MKRIRIIIEVDTTNNRATVNNMAIDLANQQFLLKIPHKALPIHLR